MSHGEGSLSVEIGRLGILGVGHLAGYLISGLAKAGATDKLLLSPRNLARSSQLATAFGVQVANDNRAVVTACDLVILATRPKDAEVAVGGLPWRRGQLVISVAAGVSLARLGPLVEPAAVVRALPLSAAAIGASPTAMFPEEARARALFAKLGSVHVLEDEQQFQAASVFGAYYAWLFAIAGVAAAWARQAGLNPQLALSLTTGCLGGAAAMMASTPDNDPRETLQALATPGGITEAGLEVLERRTGIAAWQEACDAALARLRESA